MFSIFEKTKNMRKVIMIDESKEPCGKPVEFLKVYNGQKTTISPIAFDKVVYLGKCSLDGDTFAAYKGNTITIYIGHLNSGTY